MDGATTFCSLRCRLRQSTGDSVAWAGLPVNLDFVFSREQRDKVYLQHLNRTRDVYQWRWLQDGAQICSCEISPATRSGLPVDGNDNGAIQAVV